MHDTEYPYWDQESLNSVRDSCRPGPGFMATQCAVIREEKHVSSSHSVVNDETVIMDPNTLYMREYFCVYVC